MLPGWNFLVSVAFAVIASFAIGASASVHAQNSVGLEGISPDSSISCVCEGLSPEFRSEGKKDAAISISKL